MGSCGGFLASIDSEDFEPGPRGRSAHAGLGMILLCKGTAAGGNPWNETKEE